MMPGPEKRSVRARWREGRPNGYLSLLERKDSVLRPGSLSKGGEGNGMSLRISRESLPRFARLTQDFRRKNITLRFFRLEGAHTTQNFTAVIARDANGSNLARPLI